MLRLANTFPTCRAVLLASIAVGLGVSAVAAKNLKQLAQLLSMSYLAERYVTACAAAVPAFRDTIRGPLGDMHAYRAHFEAEVFDGLSLKEAAVVRDTSGRAATLVFKDSVRRLASIPGYSDAQKIETWCKVVGREFASKVTVMHDSAHATIDGVLVNAKR